MILNKLERPIIIPRTAALILIGPRAINNLLLTKGQIPPTHQRKGLQNPRGTKRIIRPTPPLTLNPTNKAQLHPIYGTGEDWQGNVHGLGEGGVAFGGQH
jgi:hypothetical protein